MLHAPWSPSRPGCPQTPPSTCHAPPCAPPLRDAKGGAANVREGRKASEGEERRRQRGESRRDAAAACVGGDAGAAAQRADAAGQQRGVHARAAAANVSAAVGGSGAACVGGSCCAHRNHPDRPTGLGGPLREAHTAGDARQTQARATVGLSGSAGERAERLRALAQPRLCRHTHHSPRTLWRATRAPARATSLPPSTCCALQRLVSRRGQRSSSA